MATQSGFEVPIGTVLDWWRDENASEPTPFPDGYAICDGSEITDRESPLFGSRLPNLNEMFIRGVTQEVNIGQTGGAKEVALPATTGSCAEIGDNPGKEPYKARDDNQGWGSNVHIRVDGGNSTQEGQHRHNLGGRLATEPPYYGLLKIMRIV